MKEEFFLQRTVSSTQRKNIQRHFRMVGFAPKLLAGSSMEHFSFPVLFTSLLKPFKDSSKVKVKYRIWIDFSVCFFKWVIIFYFGCVEVTDPLLIVWIGLGGLGVNILGMILFAGNTTNQLIDGNKNMSNEVEGLCFSFWCIL